MTINFIRDLILAIINEQITAVTKQRTDLLEAQAELGMYIVEVDSLLNDLEEQKKKFESSDSNQAVTIDFTTEIL